MIVSARVFCNTCQQWRPTPYRRGRCAACMGTWVGGLKICCGDVALAVVA